MKKLLMVFLLMTGFAHGAGLTQISLPSKTLGERMKEFQERRSARSGIRTESVINDGYVSALLFQAAGSLPGSNGAFFKSDVMLSNFSQDAGGKVAQNLAIYWLPAGQNNLAAAPSQLCSQRELRIQLAVHDFVAETLQQSGLGAVAIFSVDANGGIDLAAQIDGFRGSGLPSRVARAARPRCSSPVSISRIWWIPSGGTLAVALGMKQDANYHCNVGIVQSRYRRSHLEGPGRRNGRYRANHGDGATVLADADRNPGRKSRRRFRQYFSANDVGQYIWSAYAVTDDNGRVTAGNRMPTSDGPNGGEGKDRVARSAGRS